MRLYFTKTFGSRWPIRAIDSRLFDILVVRVESAVVLLANCEELPLD